jgi:hypothetical protein
MEAIPNPSPQGAIDFKFAYWYVVKMDWEPEVVL